MAESVAASSRSHRHARPFWHSESVVCGDGVSAQSILKEAFTGRLVAPGGNAAGGNGARRASKDAIRTAIDTESKQMMLNL